MSSLPQNNVITNAIHKNGPNGIGSFLFFTLKANKNIDMIAPITNDIKIFKKILLNPKINPKTAISLMSPPPIPPFDIIATSKNSPPLINSPKLLLSICGEVPYNRYRVILWMIDIINKTNTKLSGIV